MKLSKEELKTKVGELITDNDIAIQLLEDIEDSMEVGEVDQTKIDEVQAKLDEVQAKFDEVQAKFDDLQEKYKQRFLKGEETETKTETEEKTEEKEELEEKEIIDIKEI